MVQASALPASIETTAAYLAQLADKVLKPSTINRRAAAIGYVHRAKGYEPPTNSEPVKAVLRGIRRRIGAAVNRKDPATAVAIARMVRRIPDNLQASAIARFSSLASPPRCAAPSWSPSTWRIWNACRKASSFISAGPSWLRSAGVETGSVFQSFRKGGSVKPDRLSEGSVADIVKRYAKAAGLDPETMSGHSLRAGFVTSALEAGADLLKVMDVTRHREVKTLKACDRRAKAFKNHAGKGFL